MFVVKRSSLFFAKGLKLFRFFLNFRILAFYYTFNNLNFHFNFFKEIKIYFNSIFVSFFFKGIFFFKFLNPFCLLILFSNLVEFSVFKEKTDDLFLVGFSIDFFLLFLFFFWFKLFGG
jgi:hypothetical protein